MSDGENLKGKRKEKRGMKGERKREREIIAHNTLKMLRSLWGWGGTR